MSIVMMLLADRTEGPRVSEFDELNELVNWRPGVPGVPMDGDVDATAVAMHTGNATTTLAFSHDDGHDGGCGKYESKVGEGDVAAGPAPFDGCLRKVVNLLSTRRMLPMMSFMMMMMTLCQQVPSQVCLHHLFHVVMDLHIAWNVPIVCVWQIVLHVDVNCVCRGALDLSTLIIKHQANQNDLWNPPTRLQCCTMSIWAE